MDKKMAQATEYLLETGRVATNTYLVDLEKLIKQADIATAAALSVEKEPIFEIGKLDTLNRLQRNAEALKFVLSIAHDACLNIKEELHSIFEERDKAEKEKLRRQKEALDREIERNEKAKEYRRRKARQEAEQPE